MKCLIKFVSTTVGFFLVLVNLCPVSAAAKIDSVAKIFADKKINTQHLSIEIRKNDKVVESINSKVLKSPASVSKLLTTYAVLQKLPLGFKFKTQLFLLNETLYIKGSGDPTFVSEKMWFLVNELVRSKIIAIKDIVVDDSLFDSVRFDESRESTRVDRAYDAPVGAMSFNWNAINIFIRPNLDDEKGSVFLDPVTDYYQLQNLTKTVTGEVKKDLFAAVSNAEKTITVSGQINKNSLEKVIYKSIDDPGLWTAHQLKSFLMQREIKVTGKIRRDDTPANAVLVASSESKSLAEILADMNKFSNNFVAEMLTKTLAAQEMKHGATLKKGVEVIRQELKNLGLTAADFVVMNPSGLTLENRLSAYAGNEILSALKNDFRTYSLVLESLPIAGIDGTLKKRMKNSVAEGWVRAKTGYIDTVVSLAGYAGRKNGDIYTFTFLYNGPREESIVREAFDQVLIYLLK